MLRARRGGGAPGTSVVLIAGGSSPLKVQPRRGVAVGEEGGGS